MCATQSVYISVWMYIYIGACVALVYLVYTCMWVRMHVLVILYICECMYSSKCCKPVYSSEHVIFPIMYVWLCVYLYVYTSHDWIFHICIYIYLNPEYRVYLCILIPQYMPEKTVCVCMCIYAGVCECRIFFIYLYFMDINILFFLDRMVAKDSLPDNQI